MFKKTISDHQLKIDWHAKDRVNRKFLKGNIRQSVLWLSDQGISMTSPRAQLLSSVSLLATPWTEAHQAPLSIGLPRQ